MDVEAVLKTGSTEGLAEALIERVTVAVSEPVHGVICAGTCLIAWTARRPGRSPIPCGALRPKGVLHGLFGTTAGDLDFRTKFIVQSDTAVKCRREPAARRVRYALQTGEIARLFEGLSTVESVLLAEPHARSAAPQAVTDGPG